MKKNKQKSFKEPKESLEQILKRISPYLPETPKAEPKQPREWKLFGKGQLPPLNTSGI